MKNLFLPAAAMTVLCLGSVPAAEPSAPPPPALSAEELAQKINEAGIGNALIRTQLEVRLTEGARHVMQLQIKSRRTKTTTDLAYRILWPNDRRDEVVMLHQDAGSPPRGSVILPHQPARSLEPSRMSEPLFDSDLSYQDAVENVYAWKKQAIVGSETVRGTMCQILESKPDAPSDSTYGRVRSWIDPVRLVPVRLEKYSSSGELVRRIDITRLSRDEKGRSIPATVVVHGPRKNTVTEFNGARIDTDKTFSDADFTPVNALH
jgi:hypothetical protein